MTTSIRDTIVVSNPATGEACGEARAWSAADTADALARARAAQPAWAASGFDVRARCIRRLVRALADDAPLLQALTAETGKPRYEAEAFEILYTLELTRYLSGRAGRAALAEERRRAFLFRTKIARVRYHARGVVGVIGPWNWPLLNNFADAIPALLAGNAVLLKPSRLTPLTSLRVERLWREHDLPRDVFQVVIGSGDAIDTLIDGVDLIFFTGSSATGRQVARRAADRLVPAILELGGRSPMIVLDDADVPRAARAAVWSAFANAGQVCIRPERVYVDRAVVEAFTAAAAESARELRQGWDADAARIDVGPAVESSHLAVLERQVADAVARGARIVAGGLPAQGTPPGFFPPTVLADCTRDMAVVSDETFGPILPIVPVEGVEEAVRLANDPPGGLSGSVWSRNVDRARDVADRLMTGSVSINDVLVNYMCVEAPLGGTAGSGLGFRHGAETLRQFCRVETIVEDRAGLAWLSAWIGRRIGFPYDARVLGVLRSAMRWLYR